MLLGTFRLDSIPRNNRHKYYPIFSIVFSVLNVVAILQISQPASASLIMKRLYEDLFTDYNRLILPNAHNNTKVIVTLGLKLGQILDFNLKQQILSTNVWVEQTWHDHRLEWNPQHYEGIDMIHVPAENIWIPDIVLFNNADGNYELTLFAKAILYANGTIVWKPPTMFRSTCEVDVEYFPFDIQTCYLRFGSWTYAGDEVEIRHSSQRKKIEMGIDLSQFYKNVEWDIIDVPAYFNEVYYECCTEPFSDITFKIVIRRKMLFYLVNLILPVALMTFMTVSVFYLPSDSNEKVTLSISILTSLIVFFLLMLEIIPPTSLAVPLFGKYLLFTLVLVSLSACVSVYVLNIHHRSPSVHKMSPRIRQLFLKTLPRLLRLDRPDPRERSSLNRFRKKKIAQQMMQARQQNKIYDLAQPLAASLNLIETLHKSYEIDPADDKSSKTNDSADDEGRYFRRYIDTYIAQLKKDAEHNREDRAPINGPIANNQICSKQYKCCARANKPLLNQNQHCQSLGQDQSVGGNGKHFSAGSQMDNRQQLSRSRSEAFNLVNRSQTCGSLECEQQSRRTRIAGPGGCVTGLAQQPNQYNIFVDDTLDMTFDYDDQDDDGGFQPAPSSAAANNLLGAKMSGLIDSNQINDDADLPSPPPPPRQLTHLSDSMKELSGRLSSCSLQKQAGSSHLAADGHLLSDEDHESDTRSLEHERLDNLFNSINMINNASDEMDTTTSTTTKTNDEDNHRHLKVSPGDRGPSLMMPGASFGCDPNYRRSKQTAQGECICNSARNLMQQHDDNNFRAFQANNQMPTKRQQQQQSHTLNGNMATHCLGDVQIEGATSLPTDTTRGAQKPSDLLLSLRLPYDQMPAHVRAAIRSILFIADSIKNEDDENSAIEDWESMSMVVDRLFLWIFFLLCTFGSLIILALAPSLYDQRDSIDDKILIDIPPSNCSAQFYAHS